MDERIVGLLGGVDCVIKKEFEVEKQVDKLSIGTTLNCKSYGREALYIRS